MDLWLYLLPKKIEGEGQGVKLMQPPELIYEVFNWKNALIALAFSLVSLFSIIPGLLHYARTWPLQSKLGSMQFTFLGIEARNCSGSFTNGKSRPDNIRILWMCSQIKKNIFQHNLSLYWLSQTTKALQWGWKFSIEGTERVFRLVNRWMSELPTSGLLSGGQYWGGQFWIYQLGEPSTFFPAYVAILSQPAWPPRLPPTWIPKKK